MRRPMRTWVSVGTPSTFPFTTFETCVLEQRSIVATSRNVRNVARAHCLIFRVHRIRWNRSPVLAPFERRELGSASSVTEAVKFFAFSVAAGLSLD